MLPSFLWTPSKERQPSATAVPPATPQQQIVLNDQKLSMRKLDERSVATAMLQEHIQSVRKTTDENARNGRMLENLFIANEEIETGDSPALADFVPASTKNTSSVLVANMDALESHVASPIVLQLEDEFRVPEFLRLPKSDFKKRISGNNFLRGFDQDTLGQVFAKCEEFHLIEPIKGESKLSNAVLKEFITLVDRETTGVLKMNKSELVQALRKHFNS